ncbi:hypothetical protein JCM10212_006726, partial [Sporobolomyces blumeae]
KTGVQKAVAQRDEDGFEAIDNFFRSPSPTRSTATARSTVKTSRSVKAASYASARGTREMSYGAQQEEDEEYEESDMVMAEDGTSLSPLTYQRAHASNSAASTARHPSSLRHSTSASGSRSVSRRGLAVATSSPNESRGNGATTTRRRLSSLSRGDGEDGRGGDEQDDDEPIVEELDLGSEDDDETMGDRTMQGDVEEEEEDDDGDDDEVRRVVEARGSAKKKASANDSRKGKGRARSDDDDDDDGRGRRSDQDQDDDSDSVGLVRLDRNGHAVPVAGSDPRGKGKGKQVERSPSPRYDGGDDDDDGDSGGDGGSGYDHGGYDDGGGYEERDFGGGGGEDDEEHHVLEHVDDYGDEPDRIERSDDETTGQNEGLSEEDEARPSASKQKAKGKGKGKGKGRGRASDVASGSQSRSSNAASKRQRRVVASQEPIIEQISRKRMRDAGSVDDDGVRRSSRQKLQPLEYWRNERVIYRKRESGVGMTAVVRVPKVEPEPLTTVGKRKRGPSSAASTSNKRGGGAGSTRQATVKAEVVPEEEGVDDMTDPDGLVWSWEGNAETTRRIAFTSKMIDPKATFNNQYQFQKIYQELDYLAGGVLVIPVGGQKSTKPAKDNSYIFYCIEGSVSVTVHRTRFSIGPGGTFFIPRGNSYAIEATSNRDVKLFFAQGRRVIELPDGQTRNDTVEESQRVLAAAVGDQEPPRRRRDAEEAEYDHEDGEEQDDEEEREEEEQDDDE